jgi:hypothetical protein
MLLHLDSRKPICVRSYKLADTLVTGERAEALGAMVLCVQALAGELLAQNTGNGGVEWELDHRKAPDIQRQFPDFATVRRRRLLRRGQVLVRWTPS